MYAIHNQSINQKRSVAVRLPQGSRLLNEFTANCSPLTFFCVARLFSKVNTCLSQFWIVNRNKSSIHIIQHFVHFIPPFFETFVFTSIKGHSHDKEEIIHHVSLSFLYHNSTNRAIQF